MKKNSTIVPPLLTYSQQGSVVEYQQQLFYLQQQEQPLFIEHHHGFIAPSSCSAALKYFSNLPRSVLMFIFVCSHQLNLSFCLSLVMYLPLTFKVSLGRALTISTPKFWSLVYSQFLLVRACTACALLPRLKSIRD